MKKVISVALFLLFCVSVAQAQLLIGGRASGMGGAGVAATDDISAAYYNPAALMRSGVLLADVKVNLGAAYTDINALSSALSNASSPSQFLLNNYSNSLSLSGDLYGIVGLNVRKIGLSVIIPQMTASINKPANSLSGTVSAGGYYETALTLGTTYSVPFLPAALDIGANIKALNALEGQSTVSSTGTTTGHGYQTYGTGSGTGFDLGVLTSFNVPFVSKVAVGAVMRNISTGYTIKATSREATLDQTTGNVVLGPEVALPDQNVTINSSTAVGAYATVPGIGLGVAADIEMTNPDTNIHIGLEYPMLLNTLILRAGVASGPNLSLATAGVELNLRAFKLGLVTVADAKNTGLTNTQADITIGL